MIFILSNDASDNARSLDDNSLGKMISDIAHVLCNVHHDICTQDLEYKTKHGLSGASSAIDKFMIPLSAYDYDYEDDLWFKWVNQCLANYEALLAHAKACCQEWVYRFSECKLQHCKSKDCENLYKHKHQDVIVWCEQNKLDLLDGEINQECKAKGYQDSCDYNPCDIHAWDTPTPWPLVMPEKYKVYYEAREIIKKEEPVFKTIESYRNYYRAKVKKLSNCDCVDCKGMLPKHDPKWTRRETPSFLGDL